MTARKKLKDSDLLEAASASADERGDSRRFALAKPAATAAPAPPALSIVAPCYNEQDTLGAFCERMLSAARDV